ncbi:MAG: universal stress protein [Thermomicrobiales bacterium]
MATTQRIIVPLDGSALAEQSIPYAVALAGASGEIMFLHVVPSPEPLRGLFGSQIASIDDVLEMATQTGTALMIETIDRWQSVLKSQPQVSVVAGDPAQATLDAIGSFGATMLVLASHGRGMAGRIAFGSVADRLARSSSVPVLIIHPVDSLDPLASAAEIRRVVVPLDGSDTANEALPIAEQVAKDTGARVVLVSAINPTTGLILPSPVGTYYPTELYEEISADMRAGAKEDLTAAKARIGGVDAATLVIDGPAVEAIQAVLETGDLVVMTSHGRSGFRRWLLGSVAEKLIRSGAAPVLLVPSSDRLASAS